MLGIKTRILNHFKEMLEFGGLKNKPISLIEEGILTELAKKELKKELEFVNLQSPVAKKANPFAARIIKATADYMPNNLGNWSIKNPHTLTSRLELSLIEAIKRYYQCEKSVAGHFGSGTTEGNIYATWIGRNFLIKNLSLKNSEKIVLIKSCLAHYSIDKAADLVGIKIAIASIDSELFVLDSKELIKQLNSLYKSGLRGFIVPLTLGYTTTGTDDNYNEICEIIEKFEKTYKDCKCFIWLDAAYSGISKIFTDNNFRPFSNEHIQLISTDFHKFLAVPYPASIMLYRKNLLNHIKKDIPYIDQLDTTLLGSRPGISVLATWMSLISLDGRKMKKIINNSLNIKNNFLKRVSDENLNIKIINNKNSMQACLVSNDKISERKLRNKYKLNFINYKLIVNNKVKLIKIYKLYFLPNFK